MHLGSIPRLSWSCLWRPESYPGTTLQQFWPIFKNGGIRDENLLDHLWMASWLILGFWVVLDSKMGAKINLKLVQNPVQIWIRCFFGDEFWAHLESNVEPELH